jgi:hypothetical protein
MGIKLLHRGNLEWHYHYIKFHEIYQLVQNISIHALRLKPATPVGRFLPTVNNHL